MLIKSLLNDSQKRKLYKLLNILPDRMVVGLQYFASLGRWPNLKNPKRFTEKLQWYKLNYRVPLMTQCADKYRARFYIEEKGLSEYLPKLYQVCDSFEEIDFERLPQSFAIKSNNGCGTNIFIKDKSTIDYDEIKKIMSSWKQVNTICVGREWAYKDIEPKIVVEELLISNDGTQVDDINDYKILCFNGEPKYAWVDLDRHIEHKRNFYDADWHLLDVTTDCPTTNYAVDAPYGFDTMKSIAKLIAKDFPFVRVDFYSVNQKVYIGEMTFYPWSGCVQYTPDEFDFQLGEHFKLPQKTIVK